MTHYLGKQDYCYLSYPKYSPRATPIIDALRNTGFRVYFNDYYFTSEWQAVVSHRLVPESCRVLIAVMDDGFEESEECLYELSLAAIFKKPILILSDKTPILPERFRHCTEGATVLPLSGSPDRIAKALKKHPLLQPALSHGSSFSHPDFEFDNDVLLKYTGTAESVVIPEGVTVIGYGAFQGNNNLKEIEFPDSLEEISSHAFAKCAELQSISLPDSLRILGEAAFWLCPSLVSAALPKTVTHPERAVFSFCKALKTIHLPQGLCVIPDAFCLRCASLTSITIPDTVTQIERGAFLGCDTLAVATLSADTEIEEEAFPKHTLILKT